MITRFASAAWKSSRKSLPLIVCGSSCKEGSTTRTLTLPSGNEHAPPMGGSGACRSGLIARLNLVVAKLAPSRLNCSRPPKLQVGEEIRMRKSWRQHSMSASNIGTRESKQIASGACTGSKPSSTHFFRRPSRKCAATRVGSSSYQIIHAPYMRHVSADVSTNEETTGMARSAASDAGISRTPCGKQNMATDLVNGTLTRFASGKRSNTSGSNVVSSSTFLTAAG
mmetsp:Transcript_44059/g.73149  ORF Transcript_44059/g.73149 Transcript_44059/m.73149 type:complete len:225 (-) Transcript_44059:338-1012(-)